MSLTPDIQTAAVARLLADEATVALLADTPHGPAVFAEGQPFDDSWPRVTIRTPQTRRRTTPCGDSATVWLTLDVWAQGPDCTLKAGAVADAVATALDVPLTLTGWSVSSHEIITQRPVGDPSPGIEHVVVELRYSAQRHS